MVGLHTPKTDRISAALLLWDSVPPTADDHNMNGLSYQRQGHLRWTDGKGGPALVFFSLEQLLTVVILQVW